MTPAEELTAAADRLDALLMNPDVARALSTHLRIAAQHWVQVPASLLDLARAILAKEGT